MVSPETFFSTIAQASAAVLAFGISVGVAFYTIERQRREQRTKEFQDQLVEFSRKYSLVTNNARAGIEGAAGEDVYSEITSARNDSVQGSWAEASQSDSMAVMAYLYLDIIFEITHQIQRNPGVRITSEQWELLENSIRRLVVEDPAVFSSGLSPLYAELTDTDPEEVGRESDYTDIPIFHLGGYLTNWLKNNAIQTPNDNFDELDGNELKTLDRIIDEMWVDASSLFRYSTGTVYDYEPDINPILDTALYLIVTGIIVPVAFLVDVPFTLIRVQWQVALIQAINLGLVSILAIALIELTYRGANATVSSTDTESLSLVTRLAVQLLGRLPTFD